MMPGFGTANSRKWRTPAARSRGDDINGFVDDSRKLPSSPGMARGPTTLDDEDRLNQVRGRERRFRAEVAQVRRLAQPQR